MDEDLFIECLKTDFPHFKVTKSNVSHPTSEFVVSYYTMLLDAIFKDQSFFEVTDAQREFLSMYQPEGITLLHHVRTQNLYKTLNYIFSFMGMNFSLSDLLFPEMSPRRSFTFMGSLINLYAYCGVFDEEVANACQDCVCDREALIKLNDEKEHLEGLLGDINQKEGSYQAKSKEIKISVAKYAEMNEQTQNVLKHLHSNINEVNENVQKCREAEGELQKALTKVENEKKHLQTLIVSDQKQTLENHRTRTVKKEELMNKVEQLKLAANLASQQSKSFSQVVELQQKMSCIIKNEGGAPVQDKIPSDFIHLNDSISTYMKIISDCKQESCSTLLKIAEAEQVLTKLKVEESTLESEQAAIYNKDKNITQMVIEYIESQKVTFARMNKNVASDEAENKDVLKAITELKNTESTISQEVVQLDANIKSQYFDFIANIKTAFGDVQKKLLTDSLNNVDH